VITSSAPKSAVCLRKEEISNFLLQLKKDSDDCRYFRLKERSEPTGSIRRQLPEERRKLIIHHSINQSINQFAVVRWMDGCSSLEMKDQIVTGSGN